MRKRSHERQVAALGSALLLGAALFLSSAPANASAPASYQSLVPASPATSIKKLDTITVTGVCPIPDSDAKITAAYPVEWPEVLLAMGAAPATSTVLIELDNRGNLVKASISTSAGNPLFDQEALLGARMSKYAPEVHRCTVAARSYYLEVRFELAD